MEHFKKVADQINREFTRDQTGGGLAEVYSSVSSITFGQNIIILRKQTAAEAAEYFSREYRYSHVVK